MTRKSIYPPDDGKDPFVYDGTPESRVAEAALGRFIAGESSPAIESDFDMYVGELERILRWWICRRKAGVRT